MKVAGCLSLCSRQAEGAQVDRLKDGYEIGASRRLRREKKGKEHKGKIDP
jgi:hypothetical protein